MRVEQALRLLPNLEALMPLRDLLLSSARPDERVQWGSGGPYLTVGKREVEPGELARLLAPVLNRVAEHITTLCGAYIEALEHQERNDAAGATGAIVRAGRLEEQVGRLAQAQAWYEVALALAEGLQDRRPEVETLLALGHVCLARGLGGGDGARHYQRALVLSEAEFDQAGAVDASVGLGNMAFERDEWDGARAWYSRALRIMEAGNDRLRLGRIEHRLGLLARRQGDLAAAGDRLRRAREYLEPLGAGADMARVLDAQGELDAALGRPGPASGAYREALAWVRRDESDPNGGGKGGLEVTIRLHLAQLLLDTGRLLEAEEEMRRAEQVGITAHQTRGLVQIYTLLGTLRGKQGDETGFVFFEQAIALCRAFAGPPIDEAKTYHAYGLFRQRCGSPDEARAYLERARDIFRSLGVDAEVERVDAELEALSA